jgi:hypothetical protein
MKRILLALVLVFSTLTFTQPAQSAELCAPLNVGLVADDNLTVTMKSIVITEKTGSNLLTITYNQLNATADKKLDEGSFKLFFADGSSEPQYGGFNYFFPNDTRDRSHTWEFLKTKEPLVIGYNAGFFSAKYDTSKLNWVLPGKPCNLAPTPPPVDWTGKQRYTSDLDYKLCVSGAEISGTKPNCGLDPAVAKANASSKAAQDKIKAIKSQTITCVKGKVTKKVTAVKPKCPAGYKKK